MKIEIKEADERTNPVRHGWRAHALVITLVPEDANEAANLREARLSDNDQGEIAAIVRTARNPR